METIQITETVPCLGSYDIIVAGGGVAGVAAAISARRCGKQVLLIEKGIKLGGLATAGLVNFFVPMCNGRGKQIIFGMAEEMLRRSIRYGYDTIPQAWQNGEPVLAADGKSPARYMTKFSAEIFALDLTEWVCSEGVELLFDTVVSRPVMTGNHCDGLLVENKTGRGFYEGRVIVDATGDADILFRAGIPTVQGRNFFTFYGQKITLESCRKAVESGRINDAVQMIFGGESNLYGKNHPEDMPTFTGTTAEDIRNYIVMNHKAMLETVKEQDRFSRDIVTLPAMAQYRTTRRIQGEYTLTENDAYRHFEDSVGAVCDFDRRDYLFEIPYRTLIKKEYDNLITAGRTAAGEGYVWDILRVIPPAIITGQAAGMAASLSIDSEQPISAIDIARLQKGLNEQQVMIHFDNGLVPAKTSERKTEQEDYGHI